ncbi:MAG: isoleucine--tRNA ligase [Bdellovibrionales bacterium]|nr:isoleucine--tRNA ligase [Bdellovibrionales bacterium]
MAQEIDYKNTINLPKTDFPMKADLAIREPETVKRWLDNKIYEKMIARRKDAPIFAMQDGPPYANGGLHMGHVLNKCLKDITIKYQNLQKRKAVFIPGWDCHGLPIEHKVIKDLGAKAKEATPTMIRELCRKEALKWVSHQREQFQRLGIIADWENPYLTLAKEFEAEEVRELGRILKNGVLYRGKKPVYWCYALQTALAEAEIEYAPHKSPSVYVKFPYAPESKFGKFDKPVNIVIWTTTPWSLPSNVAIAFNKDFEYTFFSAGEEYFLIARKMKEFFEKETGVELTDTGKTFIGSQFEGGKATHPFYERDSELILGDHVTLDAGTGAVHTAPGHGHDDYLVSLVYDLPIISPINDRGEYTDEVPEYAGTHVFKANPLIVERLKESGRLVAMKTIEHSYPHCWRSKTPLIYRATSQWFIRMDDSNYNIRKMALGEIEKTNFFPDWGVKRLTAMIEARPDWCISRQRNWGVPIPVFYCKSCEYAHMTEHMINHVADLMEKGAGIEAYFEGSTEELLDGNTECPECGANDWKKGSDILDVWFDSGASHAAVQNRRDGLTMPADLYLEGSDQHRGWFQTSLISAVASQGHAPFKTLLTHNFVNDEHGRKMSKSLGNYVDPMDLIKSSGAELLRLWTSSQDYGQDMNFSQEGFKRISETYRRYRNTFRFLVGNISDFNRSTDYVAYADLQPLDQWALTRLNELVETVTAAYEKYEYFKVYHALNNYFTVDLSAHYLDILKDRLYTWKTTGQGRRAAQTVLFEITQALVSMMAPITSFLAEETHSHFVGKSAESVFLTDFPQPNKNWHNETIAKDFEVLFQLRSEVSKQLEDMRRDKVIGSSLEAQVNLTSKDAELTILKKYFKNLPEFFIVSKVTVNEGARTVICQKATGEKCVRCWYYDELGTNAAHPKVCPKCAEALT